MAAPPTDTPRARKAPARQAAAASAPVPARQSARHRSHRSKRQRSAAGQAVATHVAPQTRLPGQPSLRRLVAREVIAWHNQHPLARQISRRDITGFGVVTLPFSPPVPTDEGRAPPRFPMFDDLSLIPGLARARVVALAQAHGWDTRPGLPEWPMRNVPVAVGWQEDDARRVHLQVVALKRGRRAARRVLVGRPAAGQPLAHVLGQRLWSLPRLAATGAVLGSLLLAMGTGVGWGLSQLRPGLAEAPLLATAPRAAAPEPSAMAGSVTDPVPAGAQAGLLPQLPEEGADPTPGAQPSPAEVAEAAVDPGDIPMMPGAAPRPEDPRTAVPVAYGLVTTPSTDPAVVRATVAQLQAAVRGLGRSGVAYQVDVTGTPEGDAVTLSPMPSPQEAKRILRLLAARGVTVSLAQF